MAEIIDFRDLMIVNLTRENQALLLKMRRLFPQTLDVLPDAYFARVCEAAQPILKEWMEEKAKQDKS